MKRVLKNWSVSVDYFTEQLPNSIKSKRQKKNLEINERYRRICKNLTDRKVMVHFAFLMSVTPLFEKFLTMFQSKGPIVHVTLDECSSLLRTVIGRFLKTDVVGDKTGRRLLEIDCKDAKNQLPDKSVEIGPTARQMLSKIPKDQQHSIKKDINSFCIAIT